MRAQLTFIYCQLIPMSVLRSTWSARHFSFKPGDNKAGRGQGIMAATRFQQSTTSEVSWRRKKTPEQSEKEEGIIQAPFPLAKFADIGII